MVTDTATIASALRAGMTLPETLSRYEPSDSASQLLTLCAKPGASPADALDRLAAVEATHAKASAELLLAAGGPRASAKLVTLLPVIVLLGAQLVGLRVFNEAQPITLVSISLGAALLMAGRAWSKAIVAKAEPNLEDPAAGLDAFALALASGLPPRMALTEAENSFGHQPKAEQLIEEAAQTGLAIARLAQSEADRVRLRWRIEAEEAIQVASVRLMWPLGLAVLPAFVLICVIPLASALLRNN